MSDFLIVAQDPSAYAVYPNVVRLPDIADGPVLNIRTRQTDIVLPGDTLIREGDFNGSLISVDEALYEKVVAFGNHEDGTPTGIIQAHQFQGAPPRAIQPTGEWYPADNEPFDAVFTHKWFDFGAGHPATGWGWQCELVGEAKTRDPSGHAVYHYADENYTAFEGTTGAFIEGPSDWQVDANGDPLTVWLCTSWDSRRFAEKADWYFAIQESGILRGKGRLLATEDSYRRLFWENVIHYVPPDAEWTDTGVTVTALFGSAYQLSATIEFGADELIRLGEGESQQTHFKSYWPEPGVPSAVINIGDPDVRVPVGTHVWRLL